MSSFSHAVVPGGLAATDKERITTLAEQGWSAGRIARRLQKHPSTVFWFMYRTGLKTPKQAGKGLEYRRGTQVVRQYSAEEDVFIQEQRKAGLGAGAIGRKLEEAFGHKRRSASVTLRLLMLASREDA